MARLRGKVIKMGDKGALRYKTESGDKVEVAYEQIYSRELGIGDNTAVNFQLVTLADGTQMAIAVNPVEKGQIVEINFDAGTGIILETESDIRYPFKQNFLRETKFERGQTVKYTLVGTDSGPIAVCLTAI